MNGNRWSPFDEVFNFQRQMDRVFDQFWNDLPNRTTRGATGAFQVTAEDDGWRIDVPMPGTDPKHVNVEVAGNTLCIRSQHPDQRNAQGGNSSYEQTLLVPQFLDLERLRATHRHGMLQLSLPLKESVKPRRIEIENVAEDQKQLTAS